MHWIKTRTLIDGISEIKDIFIRYEGNEIKYVGSSKLVVESAGFGCGVALFGKNYIHSRTEEILMI